MLVAHDPDPSPLPPSHAGTHTALPDVFGVKNKHLQARVGGVHVFHIEDLKEVINSRKCSGCGKQKQDVDRMFYLCCLCCHPIKPGQSIEEGLAACKER